MDLSEKYTLDTQKPSITQQLESQIAENNLSNLSLLVFTISQKDGILVNISGLRGRTIQRKHLCPKSKSKPYVITPNKTKPATNKVSMMVSTIEEEKIHHEKKNKFHLKIIVYNQTKYMQVLEPLDIEQNRNCQHSVHAR